MKFNWIKHFQLGRRSETIVFKLFSIQSKMKSNIQKFLFFFHFSKNSHFTFQCVDGYPYRNNCPSGLYFDDIAKYCTFKNEARCGPLATSKCLSSIFFFSPFHLKMCKQIISETQWTSIIIIYWFLLSMNKIKRKRIAKGVKQQTKRCTPCELNANKKKNVKLFNTCKTELNSKEREYFNESFIFYYFYHSLIFLCWKFGCLFLHSVSISA